MLLLVTFIAASVASRLGSSARTLLGIAEERGGRRGPATRSPTPASRRSRRCSRCRTSATRRARFRRGARGRRQRYNRERDRQGVGRRTVVDHVAARVPPGTSGAMSLEGTLAGVAGAIALGLAAAALHIVPYGAVTAIAIGSTAGRSSRAGSARHSKVRVS
jgi:hypothetical protein